MYDQYGMGRPLPQFSPEEVYNLPPELGGSRANYPIMTHLPQYGLSHEIVVGNDTTVALGQNVGAQPAYVDSESFAGDVWSIQLTARPGYYVAPDVMQELGWGQYQDDPNG